MMSKFLTPASTLAGDSIFGLLSILKTLINMESTPRTGLHLIRNDYTDCIFSKVTYLSLTDSCLLNSSSFGGWRIEMQTVPSG